MKKRIKLLCIFTILMLAVVGIIPANAAENQKDCKTEIQVLSGFGIITGYSSDSYVTRKTVTYNDFLSYLLKARYADSLTGDPVNLAKEMGLIDDEDNIKGASTVTTDIAIKAMVRTLGCENYVKLRKNTYFQTASEIGLLQGTTIKENEKLNSDNMLIMLYNMIDIGLFEQEGQEYKQSDETLITKFHNLTKVSGIVTANEFTGIYSPKEGRTGQIRINDTYYETKGVDFNDMLGKSVDAYYSENQGYTIKCIFEKKSKNEEFVISDDDFSNVNKDISAIYYYKDETSSKTSAKKLSSTVKVIYNGKAVEKYDATLFDVLDGEIRLLNNDGDDTYDFVFITDYELVFVSKVDASNNVLHCVFDLAPYSGSEVNLKKLDFSEMKLNENLFVYRNGQRVSFSDISENDIISMTRSVYSNDTLVKLYITRQSQDIEVSSINSDEIKTEDTVFELNGNYAKLIENGNTDIDKIEVGNTYTVYLDRNGKIAGAKKTGTGDENYILIYNVYLSDSGDRTFVKCVDTENEHHNIPLAQKVKIDNVQYADELKIYNNASPLFGRVVKVKYNANGEINKIEKATMQSSTDKKDTFNYAGKQSLVFRSGAGTVSFGGKYYVDGNTIVFATMDNTSKSAEDWSKVMLSRIYLLDNNSYSITPYAIDEYGYAKIILLDANTASTTLNMLVDRVIVGLNEEDVAVQKLVGPVGSIVSMEVPGINDSVFKGLNRGDYVTVTIDYEGNATGAMQIYTPEDGVVYSKLADSAFYSSNGSYMGTLNKIDYAAMRMQLNCGTRVTPKNFDMQWLEPTVYTFENGKITIGTINDLEIGDMIVMNTSYDRPSTIIAYK